MIVLFFVKTVITMVGQQTLHRDLYLLTTKKEARTISIQRAQLCSKYRYLSLLELYTYILTLP